MEFSHEPVLLEEVLAGLRPQAGGIYLDGTVGGGGHAAALLARAGRDATLIGIDHDPSALAAAGRRLAGIPGRTLLVRGNFVDLKRILAEHGIAAVDGVLLDLGVSSHQVDEPERGFSYIHDGPLDMRMDPAAATSAADLVNAMSAEELSRVFSEYGEERFSRRIAAAIVAARQACRITRTGQLAEIISRAVPPGSRHDGHPAKRVFQALRIATNDELRVISPAIRDAVAVLKPGGRLAVISFHSLEDRIVKETYRELARGCICPPRQPVCTCGRKPAIDIITSKPITAGKDELERNPRAHSAKLRVAEKLRVLAAREAE
ncbi:MAG: 16S rRNA (cytosine(1402)-N(4))-methyltransferase RsmH [Chloroflexota bacterium]